MAVYKVIQDIEAEDKLVAYLGIRQFVYVIIAVASAFVIFRMIIAPELGPARFFVMFMFFWPMVLFGILSAPIGRDQPTEVWILSRLRYYLKPRVRIWSQSGLKELVTITAPKKIEKVYTDGLSQSEVRSRLQALASTLDSRGWAVKNVNLNLYEQPGSTVGQQASDRLIEAPSIGAEPIATDIRAEDDILDPRHNSTAQHFDRLMRQAGDDIRREAAEKPAAPQPDFYFMHEDTTTAQKKTGFKPAAFSAPDQAAFSNSSVVRPGDDSPTAAVSDTDEQSRQLLEQVRKAKEMDKEVTRHSHERRIPTLAEQREQEAREKAQAALTAPQQAAIVELAKNDDFSVATVAQQANRITKPAKAEQSKDNPNEVTIFLR